MSKIQRRAIELEDAHLDRIYRQTDRLFLWLTLLEYVGGVIAALALTPKSYYGSLGVVHPHVLVAVVLGAVIAAPIVFATLMWPGQYRTRVTVAVCQMLMSALLIHLSGGRIETHFHVFGTLAFLAFYRDWRILIPATLVVAGDHLIRGIYLPESVYGVVTGAEWRFVEHACWVVFEDVILIASCKRGVQEIRVIAERQAEIEATKERVEAAVEERTEELKQSELQKTAVFDNALDGIVCTDAFGEITDINPAAERIFNVKHDEIMGKPLANLFSPGYSQKFVESGLKVYGRSGQGDLVNNSVELSVLSPSGEPFPIEVSMICVLTKDSPVYTAFVRDISQRKRLEENLAHTSKMESLGQLASGVAHEINTPNQYIGDNVRFVDASFGKLAELIAEYKSAVSEVDLPAETAERLSKKEAEADFDFTANEIPAALSQALEGVERVGSIISAMKVFAHPSVESFSEIDLNRIVESSVTVARNEWKYVADVEMDLDHTLPMIQGNRGELSQVILNLVVNSAQAIEERFKGTAKGTISITTRAHQESVVLTILDNGAGIKPEIADKVFDPFFTTKGVGVGTGQGLAIARTVIDRHSGQIRMKSSIETGTTFTIKLPVIAPEKEGSRQVA